jgi:hypothetical protein
MMISNSGYNILKLVIEERCDEIQDFDTFQYLVNKGYIYDGEGRRCAMISPAGEEAYEDYLQYTFSLQREEEALKIAQEANEIADKARKSAKHSNIISVIACIISLLSILAAVLIGIYC